jgi:hypothetical protein
MLVLPPAAQILDPVDPVLAGKPVGDRQPLPRIPTRFTGIKPVEALPALDRSAHGRLIIGKTRTVGIAGHEVRVTPVAQRHVVVDADRTDGGMRPERVEIEKDIARAVIGPVAGIFGPVGGIGHRCRTAQHRLGICRELHELFDERKRAGFVPQPGQADHFRADDEAVDAAGGDGQCCVMQDEAPVALVARQASRRCRRRRQHPRQAFHRTAH